MRAGRDSGGKLGSVISCSSADSLPTSIVAVGRLALIDLPIAFGVESDLEQPVLGVVALAASGAGKITAPGRALMIIVLGDGKGCAAAAWNQKHAQGRGTFLALASGFGFFGLAAFLHDSSTAARALFLRLFDCSTFLRKRSALGVTSTNSSSAMNSIACSRFSGRKGTSRMASSAVDARMLVSFFSRTALTSRSVSLAFSPMIMPS